MRDNNLNDIEAISRIDNIIEKLNKELSMDEYKLLKINGKYKIISQNKDIEKIYIDNFTSVTYVKPEQISYALDIMNKISEKYNIGIVLCFATDSSEVPDTYKDNIIAA